MQNTERNSLWKRVTNKLLIRILYSRIDSIDKDADSGFIDETYHLILALKRRYTKSVSSVKEYTQEDLADDILRIICEESKCDISTLKDNRKISQTVSDTRFVYYLIAHKDFSLASKTVGKRLNRDGSTVRAGCIKYYGNQKYASKYMNNMYLKCKERCEKELSYG